jgi:hypothetical protein
MFCQHCGASISQGSKFCGKCGQKQGDVAAPNITRTQPLGAVVPSRRTSDLALKANPKIKSLFVIGSQTSREAEAWLKSKFPSSQVMKFSTIGAVREAVLRLAKSNSIESLCLIGTAKTVPPHRLHDDSEFASYQRSHRDKNFKPVESDLYYCSEKLSLQNLPTQHELHSSEVVEANYLKMNPAQAIGVVPVGRIPFDEFEQWKAYFERENQAISANDASWIAVSDSSDAWVWECKTVFDSLDVDSRICCVPDETDEFVEVCASTSGLPAGTRLLVNLHGGWPGDGQSQILVDNDGNPFDLTDIKQYPDSVLFLFSCYGGNSGWWTSEGAIYNFFMNGGVAAVASSTSVWCSDPSESQNGEVPPGAVQLCAEFFQATNEGMNLGDALNYAKMKTMTDAIGRGESWFFCKAMKEVLQFSLYGAPWMHLNDVQAQRPTASLGGTKSQGSLLSQVRSGSALNQIRTRVGTGILGEIRERLMTSLGDAGVNFFSQSSQYALEALRKANKLEVLETTLNAEGFNVHEANFELISWGGTTQQLLTVPSNEDLNFQLMVFLDEAGSIIKRIKMKGKK